MPISKKRAAELAAAALKACPHCGAKSCYHCWECGANVATEDHKPGCETVPESDKEHINEFRQVLRERARRKGAQMPKAEKVAHVKSQGQTRDHHCHWPGCTAQVPPAMWGCKTHWFRLPKVLRDRVWANYRPGQEVNWTPSEEYLRIAYEVQEYIRSHHICPACEGSGKASKGGRECRPCNGSGVAR